MREPGQTLKADDRATESAAWLTFAGIGPWDWKKNAPAGKIVLLPEDVRRDSLELDREPYDSGDLPTRLTQVPQIWFDFRRTLRKR
jgi:hypothetical protein